MGRRFYQLTVFILMIMGAFYFFEREILNFVLGGNPSPVQNSVAAAIRFLASLFGKGLWYVKLAVLYLANLVLKIIGNAKNMSGVINALSYFISKLIKGVLVYLRSYI